MKSKKQVNIKVNNAETLTTSLVQTFNKIKSGELDKDEINAISKMANSIMNITKTQLKNKALTKSTKPIPFLDN